MFRSPRPVGTPKRQDAKVALTGLTVAEYFRDEEGQARHLEVALARRDATVRFGLVLVGVFWGLSFSAFGALLGSYGK